MVGRGSREVGGGEWRKMQLKLRMGGLVIRPLYPSLVLTLNIAVGEFLENTYSSKASLAVCFVNKI